MKAIYINPKGTVCYLPDCPEEPSKPGSWAHQEFFTEYYEDMAKYHEALQAAKDSAVPFADQNAGWILGLPRVKDTIHPLPSGWEVEVKQKLEIHGDDSYSECGKVAVLIPPPSSEQKEPFEAGRRWFTCETCDGKGRISEAQYNRKKSEQKEESQEDDLIVEIDDIVGGTYFYVSIYSDCIILTEKRGSNPSQITEFTRKNK